MLVTILANLALQRRIPTSHNVPSSYVEDKGGSDGKKIGEERRKLIEQDDEQFIFIVGQWVASNN